MRNTVTIQGDIVAPTGESWSADSGTDDPLVAAARRKPRTRRNGSKK
jgi:hypothetical protein